MRGPAGTKVKHLAGRNISEDEAGHRPLRDNANLPKQGPSFIFNVFYFLLILT